jgi:hypothetical protein
MRIAEPHWIELDDEANMEELEEEIQYFMTKDGKLKHPKMLVMILGKETLYERHK